jgi:23S rRNA (uracil1939-C5)-methyltransferase
MEVKKNQDYIVTIEDLSVEGEGIGKISEGEENGFPLFIKDTVIGDVAKVRVIKVKKNYGYGRLMEIITPSPNRVKPPCPVARQCGGCTLQCMTYDEQLEFKRRKVENNLRRIGGLKDIEVPMTLGMKEPWRYRNKAQVPFGFDKGRICAGFYAGRTHTIIDSEDCLIAPEINQVIIKEIKSFMEEYHIAPYDEEAGTGIVRHALIRVGFHTGQILVCLIINADNLPHADALCERLQRISGMTSICLNINKKKTNVILGEKVVNLFGPGYLEDKIGEVTFQISPQSFFQVNPSQTEVLYGKALEFAGLTGKETVWDLYCGIGTISLFLARSAKKVYGVEIIPAAIDDARGNAKRNGLDNTEFFVGKAEEVLPEWYAKRDSDEERHADVIVVDPPRKGCDSALLDTITAMHPDRIVYVSCDSATLARDLKYLTEKVCGEDNKAEGSNDKCGEYRYRVEKVQPVDMFPWSAHVETVCLLVRRNGLHIDIDVDVEEMLQEKRGQATYAQIKDYVLEQSGLKVPSLYIYQVKRKCGLDVNDSYNKPKSEDAIVPQCPPEKEEAIMNALRHFGVI